MKSLFEITKNFSAIESAIEEGQEMTPELMQSLIIELKEKTDNCVGYAMSLDDFLEALKGRKKEIEQAIKSIESKSDRYHEYILNCMENLGVNVIQGATSSLKIRKPIDVVEIADENEVPLEFVKTKTVSEIDKKGIKDALKAGQEVSGAKLSKGKVSLIYKFGV